MFEHYYDVFPALPKDLTTIPAYAECPASEFDYDEHVLAASSCSPVRTPTGPVILTSHSSSFLAGPNIVAITFLQYKVPFLQVASHLDAS